MKSVLQKLTCAGDLNQEEIEQVIFGLKEDRFLPTQVAGFLMAFDESLGNP